MAANTDMAGKPGYDENGNILMAISSVNKTPFEDYAFGADDTFATLTVSVQTEGAWIDISDKLASSVTLTIISESATPAYSYEVHIGRKASDSESAIVASDSGVMTKTTAVPLVGYNQYCTVKITPTGTGTQLNFKAIVSAQE